MHIDKIFEWRWDYLRQPEIEKSIHDEIVSEIGEKILEHVKVEHLPNDENDIAQQVSRRQLDMFILTKEEAEKILDMIRQSVSSEQYDGIEDIFYGS